MRTLILLLALLLTNAGTLFAESGHGGAKSGPKAHWSYEGPEGPSHWGDLSPAYETCKTGQNQSPINITEVIPYELDDLKVNYRPSKLEVVNNGHTIQVNVEGGNFLEIGGKRYDLLQYHFHSPSENALEGRLYDLEMHLVHKSEEGRLAVIGVFFRIGAENEQIQTIWSNMPTKPGKRTSDRRIDPNELLSQMTPYYHWMGSLTTPPCSEGVHWFVLREPLSISKGQRETFLKTIGANNRPLQPIHQRQILKRP